MNFINVNQITQKGFALPTVIIASVIMMTVLLASIGSTVSVRTAVQAQHNELLAKAAADAGIEYAKACYKYNGNAVTWSNSSPLLPNTDCHGSAVAEQPEYVLSASNVQTRFVVGEPELNDEGEMVAVLSSGTAEMIRTSNGTVWRTYHASSSETINVFMGEGVYEVMYDLGSEAVVSYFGGGIPSQQVKHGTEITILDLGPIPPPYDSLCTIEGWLENGGPLVQQGDPYVVTQPVVFSLKVSPGCPIPT